MNLAGTPDCEFYIFRARLEEFIDLMYEPGQSFPIDAFMIGGEVNRYPTDHFFGPQEYVIGAQKIIAVINSKCLTLGITRPTIVLAGVLPAFQSLSEVNAYIDAITDPNNGLLCTDWDVFSFHPYQIDLVYSNYGFQCLEIGNEPCFYDALNHALNTMNGLCPGKEIWLTEFGSYSGLPIWERDREPFSPPRSEDDHALDDLRHTLAAMTQSVGNTKVTKVFPTLWGSEGIWYTGDILSHTYAAPPDTAAIFRPTYSPLPFSTCTPTPTMTYSGTPPTATHTSSPTPTPLSATPTACIPLTFQYQPAYPLPTVPKYCGQNPVSGEIGRYQQGLCMGTANSYFDLSGAIYDGYDVHLPPDPQNPGYSVPDTLTAINTRGYELDRGQGKKKKIWYAYNALLSSLQNATLPGYHDTPLPTPLTTGPTADIHKVLFIAGNKTVWFVWYDVPLGCPSITNADVEVKLTVPSGTTVVEITDLLGFLDPATYEETDPRVRLIPAVSGGNLFVLLRFKQQPNQAVSACQGEINSPYETYQNHMLLIEYIAGGSLPDIGTCTPTPTATLTLPGGATSTPTPTLTFTPSPVPTYQDILCNSDFTINNFHSNQITNWAYTQLFGDTLCAEFPGGETWLQVDPTFIGQVEIFPANPISGNPFGLFVYRNLSDISTFSRNSPTMYVNTPVNEYTSLKFEKHSTQEKWSVIADCKTPAQSILTQTFHIVCSTFTATPTPIPPDSDPPVAYAYDPPRTQDGKADKNIDRITMIVADYGSGVDITPGAFEYEIDSRTGGSKDDLINSKPTPYAIYPTPGSTAFAQFTQEINTGELKTDEIITIRWSARDLSAASNGTGSQFYQVQIENEIPHILVAGYMGSQITTQGGGNLHLSALVYNDADETESVNLLYSNQVCDPVPSFVDTGVQMVPTPSNDPDSGFKWYGYRATFQSGLGPQKILVGLEVIDNAGQSSFTWPLLAFSPAVNSLIIPSEEDGILNLVNIYSTPKKFFKSEAPDILLAGYWLSSPIDSNAGGIITIRAAIHSTTPLNRVEIIYGCQYFLLQSYQITSYPGLSDVYLLEHDITVSDGTPGAYLLEMKAVNASGESELWPYITIQY